MTKRFARVPIAAAGMRGLGEHALRVLIALAVFANKAGRCWPSLATIAKLCGLDRRQIPRAIGKLIAVGLVTKIGGAAGRSATYQLHHELTSPEMSELTSLEMSPDDQGDIPGDVRVTSLEMSKAGPTDISGDALTAQDSEQPREQPTLLPLASENENPDFDSAFRLWNDMAAETGLPTLRKLTTPLKTSLRARLTECGGITGWNGILDQVRSSPFLRGESSSGWRATFQWTVKAENFTKIAAGNYVRSDRGRSGAVKSFLDANIEEADRG